MCSCKIRLRSVACRPAARRNPAASYITIRLKKRTTPNRTEPTPSRNPTAVVSAATDAAWELGMPPVSTKRRTLIFFSRSRKVNTLLICTRKPHASAWKRGLDATSTLISLLTRPVEEERGERLEFSRAAAEPRRDPGRVAEEPLHVALGTGLSDR